MKDLDLATSHVAIDLGAESGRVMLGRFDGERVTLQETRRFPNTPNRIGGGPRWDISALYNGIELGLKSASRLVKGNVATIGLDSWGTDFGLVTSHGAMIGSPYHYRHPRTAGFVESAFSIVPESTVYARTGSQTIPFNTLFQLLAAKQHGDFTYAAAMLMIPDLLAFWLTGELGAEATIASTTQLFDPKTRDWAWPLIADFDLPEHLFMPIAEPGVAMSHLRTEIGRACRLPSGTWVVYAPSHDTASAVVATNLDENTMFISSGTWSLAGIETLQPIITDQARLANFTNEAGAEETNRFLKNACGLWIVQECRRIWADQGHAFQYDDLTAMAASAPPLVSLIDPDHPDFMLPDDMPEAIREFCRRTGQPVPADHGEVIRTALESMALNYRGIVDDIERLAQRQIKRIQIIGGGSKNPLHCQFTANATGRLVNAGPAEATALGNVMVQALSLGLVDGLADIREVIGNSVETTVYEPMADREPWEEAHQRFLKLNTLSA